MPVIHYYINCLFCRLTKLITDFSASQSSMRQQVSQLEEYEVMVNDEVSHKTKLNRPKVLVTSGVGVIEYNSSLSYSIDIKTLQC